MAIGKFFTLTGLTDPWASYTGAPTYENSTAKIGHVNRVANYVNDKVTETLIKNVTLSAAGTALLDRDPDSVLNPLTVTLPSGIFKIPETLRLKGNTTKVIPQASNCAWAIEVTFVAICQTAGGSVPKGATFMGKYNILYKRVNGAASIVGTNGAFVINDSSMADAQVVFSASGFDSSLGVTFTAPSTASSTVFKLKADLKITDVSF